VRVTVVGCSGSFAGPSSPASSYLVPTSVDAVLLSHLHPDHCVDLCGLYVMRRYLPWRTQRPDARDRSDRIAVHGPTGTAGRMAGAYGDPEGVGMGAELDFRDLRDGHGFRTGPFAVTPRRVNHPGEAYGFRVEADGRVLCYTGDTDSCAALSPLMRGAALVLADCAFVDGRDGADGIHLSGSRAARAALDAGGVQRLMLTHLPPWNDPEVCRAQAAAVWPGAVELAEPGATYEV